MLFNMHIWETREKSMAALRGELKSEAILSEELFSLVDDCICELLAIDSEFGRVTTLMLIKARNLALGCYSLALDALAQESGALVRPLIEAWELLIYLRDDPSRAVQVINKSLPKAGDIARTIGAPFQGLREHLNENASHLSLNWDAIQHILRWSEETVEVKIAQPFNSIVLRTNMRTLFLILSMIAFAAVDCLSLAHPERQAELTARLETIRDRGLKQVYSDLIPPARAADSLPGPPL